MEKQLLLRKFEYVIPASALSLAAINRNYVTSTHLPLMKVIIDFENAHLKLEGDWQFMMAANKHNDANCLKFHRERVKIETAIYSKLILNLDDPYSDGLVLPLEGSINDRSLVSPCTGLLVIDNARGSNRLLSGQWAISFYLYDIQFDNSEIKFRLPLYQTMVDGRNN